MQIPIIRHVHTYHCDMINKGANMTFMAFLTADGKKYRTKGYVVSGYNGADSHRIFLGYQKALEFADAYIK